MIPVYPFTENKIPFKDRIKISDINQQLHTYGMYEDFYPHVKSIKIAYISGVSMDRWNDYFECIYVYCCEFKIPTIIFIWSMTDYYIYNITDFNWKILYPIPENFVESLSVNYNLGFTIQLDGVSVRNSLLKVPYMYPYQIYISSGGEDAKLIPSFNYNNIPAFDIINENNIRVYCHSSNSLNIARNDHSIYIKNLLRYCTANGIKAAVFNCGSNRDINIEEAKRIMMYNIIKGINESKFREDQIGTCKFLLETPSGKGNEMFSNIYDFINFCLEIYNLPGMRNFFGISINTCHVHQCGYPPYIYMLEIIKYLPVELVKLNDSVKEWNQHRDLKEIAGKGKIPWIYLMKISQLCKIMDIPMVREI